MKFDTPRIKALMTLGTRPDGVSPSELAEVSTSQVTQTCKTLASKGFGSWQRLGRLESRLWVTSEQYAAWVVVSTKPPKAVMVAKSTGAQWDRSAPAVITSATRVTIWQPRTRAEWIADVTA